MMHSASRRAAANLAARRLTLLDGAKAADLVSVAAELHGVGAVLVAQPRLRRMLGDPATVPDARAGLASDVFGGKIGDIAMQIVRAAVAERWSSPWNLSDALEMAGDDALFAAAEKDGTLDEVEDELFRFERVLNSDGSLSGLLDEQSAAPERRIALMEDLLKKKASPITRTLLSHAITSDRKRSLALAIDDLLEQAAARRERSVAQVISATAMTDAQQTRLASVLSEIYGRTISVRAAIDPSVRGGLAIRVGDEVIDGTIASRLAEVRAAFT